MKKNDYCNCKGVNAVTTDFDSWYEFDRCCSCGKVIEDSIKPLDHYDGEDHADC